MATDLSHAATPGATPGQPILRWTSRASTIDEIERAFIAATIARFATARATADERETELERGLLAAIYAAPADDGPRAIYADWLLGRGDPRGELAHLHQCAAAVDGGRADAAFGDAERK